MQSRTRTHGKKRRRPGALRVEKRMPATGRTWGSGCGQGPSRGFERPVGGRGCLQRNGASFSADQSQTKQEENFPKGGISFPQILLCHADHRGPKYQEASHQDTK